MKTTMEILKNLREDNDLKQEDVALFINKTQQQYSRYETGENEPPLAVLVKLADYFHVSADFLLGRTDCKEGLITQHTEILPGTTVGVMISNILSISEPGRAAIVEYIALIGQREMCKCRRKA
ncbi:MAG: helix-turn-helix domain-containing protein [Defluviitaleaceae bacterium]|nr:helix-turn-helix domain-containing protein [Defluviitaleaceae bacterium]MCL2240529.1 helix-turn-helix domain-containing protein [Defluviitaleaceae bacterium]